MRRVRLNRQERAIEDALVRGEYVDVDKAELHAIAEAIAARKKDAVLTLRINSHDLEQIKRRAHALGVKYQTFIAELLHRVATHH